jgi:hypothetical protein
LTGVKPIRITQEAKYFLKGNGICMQEENHTYNRLYGCEQNPLLLSIFICDSYFFLEVVVTGENPRLNSNSAPTNPNYWPFRKHLQRICSLT